MYALIPCPAELLEDVKGNIQGSNHYEGFWLLSQDPSLIAQAGENALCAPSKEGLVDLVDRKFKLPFGYTKLCTHSVYCYGWKAGNRNYYNSTPSAVDQAKQEFAAKCERYGTDASDRWIVYALLPAPRADEHLHDMDILAEAKCHKKGVYTTKFKITGSHKVEVLKDDFILESTPLGNRVIFDPKRAKRLHTLRKRHSTVGARRPRRTCFTLLQKLVVGLRDTFMCDAVRDLYYERWSSSGIWNYSKAVVNFFDMAQRMGKLRTARKVIAPLLRELWIHRNLIQKNCTAEFRLWYEKELRMAGGPPKDPDRYMMRVKVREEVQKDSA